MPYVPVVGPRLKRLLAVVFGLFALLVVNSVYLSAVSVRGQGWRGQCSRKSSPTR